MPNEKFDLQYFLNWPGAGSKRIPIDKYDIF